MIEKSSIFLQLYIENLYKQLYTLSYTSESVKIEEALYQSRTWSWQTEKCLKGNHCRKE